MDYTGGYGGYGGDMGYGGYGFGSGGDAGGGGFYGGQAGGGGMGPSGFDAPPIGSQGDQATSSGSKRSLGQQSLVPITIAQFKKAAQAGTDDIMIDGKDVKSANLRIVGRIVGMEERTTQLAFLIDDCTGQLEVSWWVDLDENDFITSRRASWVEDAYVSIVAKISTIGTERVVQAFDLRPITDLNEVTHHFIDVVYTHLFNTKGPLEAPAREGSAGQGFGSPSYGGGMPFSGGMAHAPSPYGAPSAYPGGSFGGSVAQPAYASGFGGGDSSGMTPVAQMVLDSFQAGSSTEHGFSVDEVARRLAHSNISAADVRRAAEHLAQEGHLYATKDEAHFKTTA